MRKTAAGKGHGMKVLIAYASKTGTAEECAGMLQKELRGADVTVADLAREKPDVRGFDAAVIGGSVRYGKLRRDAADYLTAQQDALATVPHGLFLCMSSGHEFEEISEKVFPAALRESAFAVMNFGGRLRLKRAGLFERILRHAARSRIAESEMELGEFTPTLPDILPENIARMASALRTAYGERENRRNLQ